ncbi:hypothetical protein PYX06_18835 [Citrobacter amalonaticus]|nr:hypothetical protein [Citrobacter amalonaticus]
MSKNTAASLLIAFFSTTLFSSVFLFYLIFKPSYLDCIGDADWNIDDARFVGTVSFQMHKKEGLAVITGKVDGETETNVNRLVYFNYTQQFRTRILHTIRIVKTFSDTIDDEKLEAILSQFYLKKGGELTLTVDEYHSAYVFSEANVPYLYCRKKG